MCHKFMAHPLFSFLRSFFHRISRMNWRHSCLSDYSRIFADIWPLANGWRPKYSLIVFCHADFADDADFSSWKFFVPQISQMTQIFLRGSFLSHRFRRWRRFFFVEVFCPTDFADDADFSLWKFLVSQISQITQIFLRGSFFIPQISQITQIFLRGTFSILRGYL